MEMKEVEKRHIDWVRAQIANRKWVKSQAKGLRKNVSERVQTIPLEVGEACRFCVWGFVNLSAWW